MRFHVDCRLQLKYVVETDTNYASYKLQRNRCSLLRRKAIRNFFAKSSEAENPRDWNEYRPFLHSKKHQHPNDIIDSVTELLQVCCSVYVLESHLSFHYSLCDFFGAFVI